MLKEKSAWTVSFADIPSVLALQKTNFLEASGLTSL